MIQCQCTEDDNCSCCIYYKNMEWADDDNTEWESVKDEIMDHAFRSNYQESLKYAWRVGSRTHERNSL